MLRVKGMSVLSFICLAVTGLLLLTLLYAYLPQTYGRYAREELLAYMDDDALAQYLAIDEADHHMLAQQIAAYMRGERDDLSIALSNGELAFNEKEMSHMDDVRALVTLARNVLIVLMLLLAVLECAVFFASGERSYSFYIARFRGTLWGIAVFAVLLLLLILWAVSDFTAVFHLFHRLLFTNDNWLLDPNTDLLIRLMPQNLFEFLAYRIASGTGLLCLARLGIDVACLHKSKRKRKNDHEL